MRRFLDKISLPVMFIMLIFMIVLLLLRIFVFDMNVVYGTSMYDALDNGDVLLARKVDLDDLHRGDIVTVYDETTDELLVKRIIGLPGEEIYIDDNGYIYANWRLLDDFFQEPVTEPNILYSDVLLGSNEYFIMGDNRTNSYDSRYFGPVSIENIRDVAVMRFYPLTIY